MRHPHLRKDLLGAQTEACHEIDVRCPIYFTVGWSAADAELHPEWCIRNRDGSIFAPRWATSLNSGIYYRTPGIVADEIAAFPSTRPRASTSAPRSAPRGSNSTACCSCALPDA